MPDPKITGSPARGRKEADEQSESLSVKTIENVQGGFRHDLITLPLLPSELEEREQKAIEKQIEKQKTAVQEEEKDEEPTKDNEKESDNGDLEDYLYRTFFK